MHQYVFSLYICFFVILSYNDFKTASNFFGAELVSVIEEDQDIPILLDKLFITIEVKALFIEGIYRKSAALSAVRTIRKVIEITDGFIFIKINFFF